MESGTSTLKKKLRERLKVDQRCIQPLDRTDVEKLLTVSDVEACKATLLELFRTRYSDPFSVEVLRKRLKPSIQKSKDKIKTLDRDQCMVLLRTEQNNRQAVFDEMLRRMALSPPSRAQDPPLRDGYAAHRNRKISGAVR